MKKKEEKKVEKKTKWLIINSPSNPTGSSTSMKISESSKQIPKAKKSGIKPMVGTKMMVVKASLNQKTIHFW